MNIIQTQNRISKNDTFARQDNYSTMSIYNKKQTKTNDDASGINNINL